MENNLDRFFRKGLAERQFEPTDANWQDALRLLDAERRRRRLAAWRLGGALAGLLALAGWWWLAVIPHAPLQREHPAVLKKEVPATTGASHAPADGSAAASGKPEQSELSDLPAGAQGVSPGKPSSRPRVLGASRPAAQEVFSQKNAAGAGGNDAAASAGSSPGGDAVFQKEAPAADASQPQAESQSAVFQNQSPDLPAAATPAPLTALALRQVFLEGVFPKKLAAKSSGIWKNFPSKLTFGLTAAQLFQASPGSGEKRPLGWQGGLSLRWSVSKHWHLATGLQYQRRGGAFESSKTAEARNYRFRLERDTAHLRPTSLHYLSLPLLAGWHSGRHVVEGGFAVDFLAGLRGEKGSYVRLGEPPRREFQASEKGWLVQDGFKKLPVRAVFGYQLRVSRQWSLGLSANWTFGGILEKDYAPPTGGFLLRESDEFFLTAGAAYFLLR